MPQRKDYDVYAGNQKVGEIWSEHPTKTEYEREIDRKIAINQHIRHEMGYLSESFYAKEKKMKRNGTIRVVIGAVIIIAAIIILIKFERNGWQDCILPSVLFGVGLALVKSDAIVSVTREDVYIDKEEIVKGVLWGVALFVGLVVWYYVGSFAKDFFGIG